MPSSHRGEDSAPRLNAAGEQAWTEFRYHVEWSDGFSLIFLFSSHPLLASLFHQRLQAICATRVSALQTIAPRNAEQLAEEVLTAIRNRDDRFQALAAPLWIEAGISGDPGWLSACDLMLARLNEYRDMLRSRINRPVIISLPGGYRQRAREIAPDLWSIRTYSLDLDDIGASVPQLLPSESEFASHPEPEPLPSIKNAEAILAEWQRLVSRDATGRETRAAGWRAIAAALSLGRLEQARDIAQQVVLQARQALQDDPTETALRDLSISLDKVGDTVRRQGDLEGAEAAYRESLDISRLLRERLGDTPETLRDLSVSLNNVGDTVLRQGDLEGAEAAYRESLDISRQLRERLGDTPETLRDLSISLNNVGDTVFRQEDLEGAEAAYRESLKLRRTLRERLGDTPETLRDLFVSLSRIGDIAVKRGEKKIAEGAYQESRAFIQRLQHAFPNNQEYEENWSYLKRQLDALHRTD